MKPLDGKVVLLGATSVGKTSIIARAVAGFYYPGQEPTVGTSFSVKTIPLPTRTVKLWIWDTAGQERFRTLGSLYYQGAQAVILVFSLAEEGTLTEAERWAGEVKERFESAPLLYLVGNKMDLTDKRVVPREDAVRVADKIGALYLEASAARDQNIREIFHSVAEHIAEGALVEADRSPPVIREDKCGC
jgi:Ras-related protein Rab-5C